MPKKFKTENTKAVIARERKAQTKKDAEDTQQKQREDELWKDDDRLVLKKQKRNEEKEAKKQEKITRRRELKEFELQENQGTEAIVETSLKVESEYVPQPKPIKAPSRISENNILFDEEFSINNKSLNMEEVEYENENSRNKKDQKIDRHPEKRMKLAFREFEEVRLPELRKEFPKMRYKQHLKMMRDEFEKSDVNPMNKPHMSYNAPDERKVKVIEKKLEKLSLEAGCENNQE